MSRSTREYTQATNYNQSSSTIARVTGNLRGQLEAEFRHREADVEQSTVRFNTAVEQGWEIVTATASSGAHGWQIEENDDGESVLADGAYCDDISWIVFENGWLMKGGGLWLEDGDSDIVGLAEGADERRSYASGRIGEARRSVLEDCRISRETGPGGHELDGWFVFEPTGYVGTAPAVEAHALGFDLAAEPLARANEVRSQAREVER